jgi:3-hydroxyacyl-[acyl-carrier-protein] dehydratase
MRLEYFQLIDRVVEISLSDRTIRAEARVPDASPIFEGHFPGHPLMPGVLLIESMAQAAGWLLIAFSGFERMPFLAGVKDAKLRRFVQPGEALSLQAGIVHDGSGYAITQASIAVDNKRVCDADLTFRIMPFPTAAFRAQMMQTAARIAMPTGAVPTGADSDA